jgi:formate dehydrogenase subunit gamma
MDAAELSSAVAEVIRGHAGQEGPLLPILHDVMHRFGWIAPEAVVLIARALNLSRAEVHGVISYYPHFRTTPARGPVLQLCEAESCLACGAAELRARVLGRPDHEALEVETVYCLGLCAQSPAVMLDGRAHARLTPQRLDRLIDGALRGATADSSDKAGEAR